MHFTRMGGYRDGRRAVIVRGDGCYLEDANGKRYLDALAGLFSVNIGYGFGEEIGQAALEQMRELPFYTNWTYAHPRAIELAAEVASLAPGDLNRVVLRLRRLGGGRVGVEARAPVLPRARREAAARASPARRRSATTTRSPRTSRTPPRRYKAITRQTAYHGTTLGALSLTGIPAIRVPFEPLAPRGAERPQHEPLPPARRRDGGGVHGRSCSTSSSGRSRRWGRRPCASSTWSPCRTRAAPSRRRSGTGRASASSATATTSCSRPTR